MKEAPLFKELEPKSSRSISVIIKHANRLQKELSRKRYAPRTWAIWFQLQEYGDGSFRLRAYLTNLEAIAAANRLFKRLTKQMGAKP